MTDCPNCEYHKQRAHRWRVEAYRLAGHPLPERDAEQCEYPRCACDNKESCNQKAQPETPYKIGQRIAKTGGGISHLWSAVLNDGEIAEAERGFKEALAQPEQEPVALYVYKPALPRGHRGNVSDGDLPWVYDQDPSSGYSARMLVYTTPPQRTWVGLTDDELVHIGVATGLERAAAYMIEAKLKEKNT